VYLPTSAPTVAAVGAGSLVQSALIGAGAGSFAGRLIVHRVERRLGKELSARRVRQVEATWIYVGAVLGAGYRLAFG
jgi:hypothetical protein